MIRSSDTTRKYTQRSKSWSNFRKRWCFWHRKWRQNRFRYNASLGKDQNWLWRATLLLGRYKIWNKSKTKRPSNSSPSRTSSKSPRATYMTLRGPGSWRARFWTVSASSSSLATSSLSPCASNRFQKSFTPISPGGSKAFQFLQGANLSWDSPIAKAAKVTSMKTRDLTSHLTMSWRRYSLKTCQDSKFRHFRWISISTAGTLRSKTGWRVNSAQPNNAPPKLSPKTTRSASSACSSPRNSTSASKESSFSTRMASAFWMQAAPTTLTSKPSSLKTTSKWSASQPALSNRTKNCTECCTTSDSRLLSSPQLHSELAP